MIELRREAAIVPTIVIHEVYKFEYQKFGRETANMDIRSIETAGFSIADLTISIAKKAAILRCRYGGVPTADSIIAATAMEYKSYRVVSDDEHFAGIKEIKSEWV
jgi:predicted nucleic acid-binding protein